MIPTKLPRSRTWRRQISGWCLTLASLHHQFRPGTIKWLNNFLGYRA